jgi:hypothetical protein
MQSSTSTSVPSGSVKNKIVHPDLQAERDKACFDTDELKTFHMGGKAMRAEKEKIDALFESEPLLRRDHKWFDMTREEQQEKMYQRMERLHEIDHDKFYKDFSCSTNYSYMWRLQGQVRYLPHLTIILATKWPPLHHVLQIP